MAAERFDLVIVGGGIVGLATAMEAARRFPRLRLLVLEKEATLAAHQTGHNSGVIHTGLYYRPGSQKATACVEGARLMADFCRAQELPLQICGKVVVAVRESELPILEDLHRRGTANGVQGLALIGPDRLREIEPFARGRRALHAPTAAITDFAAVARRFAAIVTSAGGTIRTCARVTALREKGGEALVETTAGAFASRLTVNCGGLQSDRLARMGGAPGDSIIVPFRGEYYAIVPERRHLVRGLIYPVPDPRYPFLGVHLTRRVDGGVDAGPNAVLAFKREGYRRTDLSLGDLATALAFPGFWRMAARHWRTALGEFHRSFNRTAFLRAVQRLVPDLRASDIRPGGAGVRAQALDRSGALIDDFCFDRRGRFVHVLNVPSPAATASIVVGRRIVDQIAAAL